MAGILALSVLFGLTHEQYVTFLPKSITTAIGMGVSEELGGIVTITVAVIILTGILGNVIASAVCSLFRIEEPIAKGLAIGTASHAIGTARALEIGQAEGAMSSRRPFMWTGGFTLRKSWNFSCPRDNFDTTL